LYYMNVHKMKYFLGLPFPKNVRIAAFTNTSVTVSWTSPTTTDTVIGYYVSQ